MWPDEDFMAGSLSCKILISFKIWFLLIRLMLTYFKKEVASICEGGAVDAVAASFTVAMAVLAGVCLRRSMFLSTFSHLLHIIFVMRAYEILVASAYMFQSVSSLQLYRDTLCLLCSLSMLS